jgi:hypothetical protein
LRSEATQGRQAQILFHWIAAVLKRLAMTPHAPLQNKPQTFRRANSSRRIAETVVPMMPGFNRKYKLAALVELKRVK